MSGNRYTFVLTDRTVVTLEEDEFFKLQASGEMPEIIGSVWITEEHHEQAIVLEPHEQQIWDGIMAEYNEREIDRIWAQ